VILLVEGEGDRRAVPWLLQRHGVPSPARVIDMKGKSNIVRSPRGFEDTVRREVAAGNHIFTILIDGDVTSAPYASLTEEQEGLHTRAQAIAAELSITVEVYWALIEWRDISA
jgi:hypothetical protein